MRVLSSRNTALSMIGGAIQEGSDALTELSDGLSTFIKFGGDRIGNSQDLKRVFIDIFETTMSLEDKFGKERAEACRMGQSLMLHLCDSISELIPPIIIACIPILKSYESDKNILLVSRSLFLHSILLLAATFISDTADSFDQLTKREQMSDFLKIWTQNACLFDREQDTSIFRAAIAALMELMEQGVYSESSKNENWQMPKQGMELLVSLLKLAIRIFSEKKNALAPNEEEYNNETDDQPPPDNVPVDDSSSEVGGAVDDSSEMESLWQGTEDMKLGEEEEDEEDSFESPHGTPTPSRSSSGLERSASPTWSLETDSPLPLDNADSLSRFTAAITTLSTHSPLVFQSISTSLGDEGTEALLAIVNGTATESGNGAGGAAAGCAQESDEVVMKL